MWVNRTYYIVYAHTHSAVAASLSQVRGMIRVCVLWSEPDPIRRVLHYQSKPMSHNRRQITVTDIRAMPQHYFWQLSDDSFQWQLPPGEPELPTLRLPPSLSRVEIFKIGKKVK